MAPPSNVPRLQLGEMAFESQPREVRDVFFHAPAEKLCGIGSKGRAIGPASLKEMLRNEGTRLLYSQRCRVLHPGRTALIG